MKMLLTLFALTFSLSSFAGTLIADTSGEVNFSSNFIPKEFAAVENNITPANYHRLFLTNNCHETVRIAVVFVKLNGEWDTEPGYYQVTPGQTAYIADTRNIVYYIAGKSISGRYTWSGNTPVEFNDGSVLRMIESRIQLTGWGDWEQRVSCR